MNEGADVAAVLAADFRKRTAEEFEEGLRWSTARVRERWPLGGAGQQAR